MAGKKTITNLSELTSAASNDVLPIVDVSDQSVTSSGETKKITVTNLRGSLSGITTSQMDASSVVTESEGISSNDNDTTLPTSAAVKDYVDTNVTAQDLDIQGDSGTGAVDLDSQSLDIAGGSNVTTAASGQTLTVNLDSTLTGLTSVTSTGFTGDLTGDVTGDVTGNVTGNVTGDVTGNADTATALETARTIAGTSFDGSGNIDIEAVNIKSTAETGGTKFLREDGDGTCSWQTVGGGTVTSVGGTGTVSGLTLSGTVTSIGDLTLGGTLEADLTSDVTGTLPVANGGTGSTTAAGARTALDVDVAGTDNSTDVTLATVTSNYLSISGQVITAGTVPVALGGTGATTASAALSALGGIAEVSEDTSPSLGGNLDVVSNEINTSTSNGNIVLNPDGTGCVEVKGDGTTSGTTGAIQLNCSNNNHGVKIQSPAHSAAADYTLTLPTSVGTSGQVLSTDGNTSGATLSWVNNSGGGGGGGSVGGSTGELQFNNGGSFGGDSNLYWDSSAEGLGIGGVTDFSSSGANAKLAINAGFINVDDDYGLVFGGGTSRPAIQGSKADGEIYITNANLGIGTSVPSEKLSVSSGNILIDNNQSYRSKNTSGITRSLLTLYSDNKLYVQSPSEIKFQTNQDASTVNAMTIDSSGKLGVGGSPTGIVSLQGDFGTTETAGLYIQNTGTAAADDVSPIAFTTRSTSWGTQHAATIAAGNSSTSAGGAYLTFKTSPTGEDPPTERMRIDSNGCGIGTEEPSAPLHVTGATTDGDTIVQVAQTSTGYALHVSRDVNSAARPMAWFAQTNASGGSSTAVHIQQSDSDEKAFGIDTAGTHGSPTFSIKGNGAIGLGSGLGSEDYGTSGQVLTSGGSSAAPSWTSAGTVTSINATSNGGLKTASGSAITASGTLGLDVNSLSSDTYTSSSSSSDSSGWDEGNEIVVAAASDSNNTKKIKMPCEIGIACSDESTALSTGDVASVLIPRAMTVTEVKASLTTEDSSDPVEVDFYYSSTTPGSSNGSAMLTSTYLNVSSSNYMQSETGIFDDGSGSATDTYSLAEDSFVTVKVESAGTEARGLKVWLLGYWS
tara:strand:+ start:10870 stop:14085 length:3216 start_codon:yes stop_codon:yes gene_type:complete